MTSGHFLSHCRAHLKAWISLVVIVQCLVLIGYLVLVSDKEPQPPLVNQGHTVTKDGARFLATTLSQVKEYPIKQSQFIHPDHLKRKDELRAANDVLFRKIGSKKIKKEVNLADKKKEVLKKVLMQQARWAEKVERHKKQKVKGFRSSIRGNSSFDSKGSNLHFRNRNSNESVGLIGRELKKVSAEKAQEQVGIRDSNHVIHQSRPGLADHDTGNAEIKPSGGQKTSDDSEHLNFLKDGDYFQKYYGDIPKRPKGQTSELSQTFQGDFNQQARRKITGNISQNVHGQTSRDTSHVEKDNLRTNSKNSGSLTQKLLVSSHNNAEGILRGQILQRTSSQNQVDEKFRTPPEQVAHTFKSINITDGILHTPLESIPAVFHVGEEVAPSSGQVAPSSGEFEIRKTPYSTYQCYKPGTKPKVGPNDFLCVCKKGWHGKWCSFPDSFYYSGASMFIDRLRPRSQRRRIVNAIPFNVEWELLEARLHELNDTVDVFILMESNYTMHGDHKPLRLLEKFHQGYLQEYHHKILYLYLDTFPPEGREDGWVEDHYIRTFLSTEGLRRVSGLRPDDLFISTDADELPTRETLAFLAFHDGYPEPFGFALRWSVFGFFWRQFDATKIYTGCSIRMLHEVFHDDIYLLRTQEYHDKYGNDVTSYAKRTGNNVTDWIMGDNGFYAGWHCSWCMSPDRIRTKLTSAINADFPRWGDYPEKLNPDYIRSLIRSGTWFDDYTKFGALVHAGSDPNFAPDFLLNNFEKYKTLLDIKAV